MLRRWLRIVLPGGLFLGLALLVRRTVALRDEVEHLVASPDRWPSTARPPVGDPSPPEPAAHAEPAAAPESPAPAEPAWVAPTEEGSCSPAHPVRAKAASGIYHLPGMANYQRTKPDRCYADAEAAEADGFTRAKR